MHLQFREALDLEATAQAVDLGHAPAELLVMSFADSELSALAAARAPHHPSLRVASLGRLRHPLSIDLYLEKTASQAKAIVIRLLGGLDYWRYGVEEIADLARRRAIPLALLPGDGGDDPRLASLSTVDAALWSVLDDCFRQGGPANLRLALDLASHAAGLGPPPAARPEALPPCGDFPLPAAEGVPVLIVFYRSHRLAGDTSMVSALAAALAEQGLAPHALHVASLKDPACAAFVEARIAALTPAVILNLTGFSARLGDAPSPLDAGGVPVLQLLQGSQGREAWQAGARGLGAADLAMQVVLPELDGRLTGGVIAFKERDSEGHARHIPDPAGIALAAARAAALARLAAKPPAARRLALVLSDYPGVAGQAGHAVGLDSFASAAAILTDLVEAGYDTSVLPADRLAAALTAGDTAAFLSLADYETLFARLPAASRARIGAAWGPAAADPALAGGWFHLAMAELGQVTVLVQPDRGRPQERKAEFHDPDLPPRHLYVAFHLWLRERVDALIHLGTHGTLEWLPGKAVALGETCFPAALLGPLPVVYPFIVNNPGEAAQAKRRLGAVTIGHLTPPLRRAGLHGAARDLERLIDEFAAADGLDARRSRLLKREILDLAGAGGLLAESGIPPETDEDTALARLDAWLCDVKDLQIRDGLHVFGRRAPALGHLKAALPASGPALEACAEAERLALLAALDGRQVAPGPAGAPTRGRADVLPTGRNLFTIDPRAVPNRSALVLAEKAAAALIERYLQDHGDWPRRLVIDLWGSATMRTGGEDLALALLLIGARPLWDEGSARVTGTEIVPLATLGRPRVDVTLRISGLFRDAFAAQIALFDQAVQAIARRNEAPDWNPLAEAARLEGADFRRATMRIYGTAPGSYGAGVTALTDSGDWQERAELAADYLARGAAAYGADLDGAPDPAGFAARIATADALVHGLDHDESDLFESTDVAAHMGGFAAGNPTATLYIADQRDPETPRLRPLRDEISRVTRGRAANPRWIAGMMRHGYRGAAEIARTVEPLFVFAATMRERLDPQFDLLFAATLGDAEVDRFLSRANPAAREAMAARFAEALQRGLWHPRRNDYARWAEERR